MKIKVAKAEDRDTMIVILARNGYTVRQGKEKRAGEKTITYRDEQNTTKIKRGKREKKRGLLGKGKKRIKSKPGRKSGE